MHCYDFTNVGHAVSKKGTNDILYWKGDIANSL